MKSIQQNGWQWPKAQNYQYLLLFGITLIAAGLRFYKLGEWSFWWDEMFTLRDSENPFQNGIYPPPAVSFTVTYIVRTLIGTSEWSTRLAPAVVGVISIPILYFPIRKIYGVGTALLASLLLALSPWHIYWSQNARFYIFLLLFYTLALIAFYFWLEKDRFRYLVLALIFLALAASERLTALFFVPVVAAYIGLLLVLPIPKPPGLRLLNLSILFVPGLIVTLFFAWEIVKQPTLWLQIFGWVNNNPFWILAGVVYYVGIPTVCMAAFGGLYLLSRNNRAALFFGLGAVIPLIALLVLSLIQYAANRYAFITLTSWIVLASAGATALLTQTQGSARLLAGSALAILLLTPLSEDVLYYRYQNGNRDDWKAAFAYVEQQKSGADIVVASNAAIGAYYLSDPPLAMEQVDLSQLEEIDNRVWFVADMNVEPKWPHLYRWLNQNARLMAEFDVHVQARNFTMRVYLYDPRLTMSADRVSLQQSP